jgi:hypothetical protein
MQCRNAEYVYIDLYLYLYILRLALATSCITHRLWCVCLAWIRIDTCLSSLAIASIHRRHTRTRHAGAALVRAVNYNNIDQQT